MDVAVSDHGQNSQIPHLLYIVQPASPPVFPLHPPFPKPVKFERTYEKCGLPFVESFFGCLDSIATYWPIGPLDPGASDPEVAPPGRVSSLLFPCHLLALLAILYGCLIFAFPPFFSILNLVALVAFFCVNSRYCVLFAPLARCLFPTCPGWIDNTCIIIRPPPSFALTTPRSLLDLANLRAPNQSQEVEGKRRERVLPNGLLRPGACALLIRKERTSRGP
ncbi:hypothetical protein B0H67DRAFT_277644 [Lasiosphaeris hirsuta]|uniref:Uncharacterized protein n=1 Tax=Lasiosphaeris hirsuta TaxID=260670 RepID=A0AA40A8N9_9PEZI|nr:hypothetical protein B0H67DRAFT_277644 [Lasiosphaeris hirsuta]